MNWTEELIDEIAIRATKAMHKEFDDLNESQLKDVHQAIVPGVVRHVLNVAEKIRAAAEEVNQ